MSACFKDFLSGDDLTLLLALIREGVNAIVRTNQDPSLHSCGKCIHLDGTAFMEVGNLASVS